jgi:predicted dehydrogenase
MMTPIILIGYGYWGEKIARCLEASAQYDLCSIIDSNPQAGEKTSLKSFKNLDEALFEYPQAQAVAIAVPMGAQSELVEQALKRNLHVLVTKTLASSSTKAKELIRLAQQRKLALFVDYTFLHAQGHKKVKSLIQQMPELYWPNFLEMRRRALGKFDLNLAVHWDLACHDLSLIFDLFPEQAVKTIQATELTNNYGVASQTEIILTFEEFKVRINSAWDTPKKVREIEVLGKRKNILYSGCYPKEKLEICNIGHSRDSENEIKYSSLENEVIELRAKEPLLEMIEAFSQMTLSPQECPSEDYLKIIKLLEMADQSLREGGKKVYL